MRNQISKIPLAAQSERFKQAARELGCDDNEERFGKLVQKIAKAGPQHKPSKVRKAKA